MKNRTHNNFKHLCGNTYLVKNQNGFNNALYHFLSAEDNNDKKNIREAVQHFPTKYPAVISIYSQMFECSKIFIDIIYLTAFSSFFIKLYFKLFKKLDK